MSSNLHSKENLEFITVAAEFCIFLENLPQIDKKQFVSRSVKYLPLLYLKTTLLPIESDEFEGEPERVVSETDYEMIRGYVASSLGMDDSYLEVFHPDMQYSDTPIAAAVSEDLADIYQELKDFLYNCQIGSDEAMQESLNYCLLSFRTHWGQKLLNALRAIHQTLYKENGDDELGTQDFPPEEERESSFMKHQRRN
jgi:hypothetical protein